MTSSSTGDERAAAVASAARRIQGALTGCAVGDSLGLVREGLSPSRAERLLGDLGHAFFMGKGIVSDDTDHSCLSALAVLRSEGDVDTFARWWGRYLAGWLWTAPYGVGFATLRAGVKLSLGFGPERSGVDSAGNGPAMRAPVLGVVLADDAAKRRRFVEASARASHTDPRAVDGAQLVATGAAALARAEPGDVDPVEWLSEVVASAEDPHLAHAMEPSVAALEAGRTVREWAADLDLERGVSGFVMHTVPVALYAAARHLDEPAMAIEAMIGCGGDTDTTAAITGALVGALHGPEVWSAEWREGVVAWPFTEEWRSRLATALAEAGYGPGAPEVGEYPVGMSAPLWALPLRHLGSFPVLLGHVVRRAFPPY